MLTSANYSTNNIQVQSAAFSCDGEVVVVGTVTGKWVVMDSRTKEVFGVHQVRTRVVATRDDTCVYTCVGRTEPSPSSASSSPPTAPSWPSPPARPYTCTGERCHVSRVESHATRAQGGGGVHVLHADRPLPGPVLLPRQSRLERGQSVHSGGGTRVESSDTCRVFRHV